MISLELPPRQPPSPGLTVRSQAMVAAGKSWCEPLSVLVALANNLPGALLDVDEEDWEEVIATSLDHYVRRMGLTCSNPRAAATAMAWAWGLSAKWVRE